MNFPISQDKLKRVIDFCITTDEKNSSLYKSRGQGNTERRLRQNFSGKLAELFIDYYFNCGKSDYVLEDTGLGVFRPDLVVGAKRWSVKSQDESSGKEWGFGRFVFGTKDPLESDVYCGIIVKYTDTPSPYFNYWTNSISGIDCSFSFVCHKSTLFLPVWAKSSEHLKYKRILIVDRIPVDKRIDLRPNFPKAPDVEP